ncbi:MAG: endonuclease V [Pseudomonadales bacterium]|nr:endonuclease V [Pseudomonadales bacterium]
MKTNQLHPWSLSLQQAQAIQKNLSAWLVTESSNIKPKTVARVEIHPSGNTDSPKSETASVTLFSIPDVTVIERKHAIKNSVFPKVEGMLSFRKAPAAIAALEKLSRIPDLIICDGRGRTSEKTFGVASHVGLITNLPTIGIRAPRARDYNSLLGNERGEWLALADNDCDESVLLRVINGLDPMLVSPAHKISQKESVEQILGFIQQDTPARQYLDLLYPCTDIHHSTIPVLQVIAKQS